MATPKTVMIIGGGMGGMTSAIALAQRGFRVRVYEQSRVLREVGAGLTLPSTSLRVFENLGLWDQVRELCAVAQTGFVHYQTLELFHGMLYGDWTLKPDSPDQPSHAHRADVHDMLVAKLNAIDPQALRLDHRLTGLTQDKDSITASFQNGETATGDLLIAADGARSAAYRAMFGQDNAAVFTGSIAIRCMIPRDDKIEPFLSGGRSVNYIAPGKNLIRYGLRNGTLVNCVALARADTWREEGWSNPCPREEFLALYSDFHPDVIGLIENAPADNIFKWGLHDRAPLTNWTAGRAVLLGDAAHPMLPYLGQGATAAIEDALVLARALEAHANYEEAFAAYQDERIPRTTHQMIQSTAQGEALNLGPDRYNQTRPSQGELGQYDPAHVKV